jgi:hypothetical protein
MCSDYCVLGGANSAKLLWTTTALAGISSQEMARQYLMLGWLGRGEEKHGMGNGVRSQSSVHNDPVRLKTSNGFYGLT